MKRDVLFTIQMIIVSVLLFLFRITGIATHIVVSAIGLLALITYTIRTKEEWKRPVVEIFMRVFYATALVTGAVLMKVHDVAAVSIIHKISAALFVLLLVAIAIHKNLKK